MKRDSDIWQEIWERGGRNVDRINELVEQVDAEVAFRVIMLRSLGLSFPGKPAETPVLQERAARLLMPRFGLPGSADIDLILELEGLLVAFNEDLLLTAGEKLGFADPIGHTPEGLDALRIHGDMIRGDAFPTQTLFMINGVLEVFDEQFKDLVGLAPSTAVRILDVLFSLLESKGALIQQKLNLLEHNPEEEWVELSQIIPVSPESMVSQLSDVTEEEIEVFVEMLACRADNVIDYAQSGLIRYKPLFVMPDKTIIPNPSLSAALDSIFFSFEEVARETDDLRDKYLEHASAWFEAASSACLARVFGPERVFRNLSYPDPDHPNGTAEIDLLVVYGPFVLLGEVKGTQLKLQSRRGDQSRLRKDLRRGIESAHDQSLRAEKYINEVDTATFREISGERTVRVRRAEVSRFVHLNVTKNHYGFAQTDLSQVQSFKLFSGGSFPWSISLMDLETVTQFLSQPDRFIHYAKRRNDLQVTEATVISDELDCLEAYLRDRLQPDLYWERTTDTGQRFSVVNFGAENIFEAFYEFDADPDRPHPELKIPPLWSNALELLGKGGR